MSVLVRPDTEEIPGPAEAPRPISRFRSVLWWAVLVAIGGIGFGIRFATVLGRPNRKPGGDPYYYHYVANLLVSGKGFLDPWRYYLPHHPQYVQSAAWPPLFVFVLAAASLVGFKTFFAHRVWCCIVGAIAVVVCGLAGRTVVGNNVTGRRVGLITALVIALYPNIWMSVELGMSETLSPLLVALVLIAAYRFWRQPGYRRGLVLGAVMGIAALGRDELALLVPFILVPLALLARLPWRRRLAIGGVGVLATLVVVAPWVGYNMSRFQNPTFISNGFGVTLASANCDTTYSGQFEGYWSFKCENAVPATPGADESVRDSKARAFALHYIHTHQGRFFRVELARLGRAFGAFHPVRQITFDYFIETRPYHWALIGLGAYYGLCLLTLGGTVILRWRRIPSFPMWAVGLDVAISVLLTFGQTRYRTPFEVCLAIMAAVQLEWLGATGLRSVSRLIARVRRLGSRARHARRPGLDRVTVPVASAAPAG